MLPSPPTRGGSAPRGPLELGTSGISAGTNLLLRGLCGPGAPPFPAGSQGLKTLLLGPETLLRAPLGSLPPGRSVAAASSPGASGSGSPSPRGSFSQSVDDWKQQSPCVGTGLALSRRPGTGRTTLSPAPHPPAALPPLCCPSPLAHPSQLPTIGETLGLSHIPIPLPAALLLVARGHW